MYIIYIYIIRIYIFIYIYILYILYSGMDGKIDRWMDR